MEHAGTRRRRHQQILCKECGTALFVLPLDAYPAPTKTGSKKRKRPGESQRSGGAALKARDAVNQLAERAGQKASNTVNSFVNALRWVCSPVKLAIYAVIMVVVGTGWYVTHQQAITQAETDIVTEAEAGFRALQEGEYNRADEHLNVAAAAVRILDRTDEPSRRIEQAAREAKVLANLAPISVVELVRRVDQSGVESDGKWKPTERISFEDQWIAFDATVEKRSGKYAVTLPIKVGDRANIFIRVDCDRLNDVPFEDSSQILTFAGKIESVEQVSSAWNVIMDPESVFLWESPDLYAKLGFVIDPVWNTPATVFSRLAQQRTWQGGEALPEDDDFLLVEEPTEQDSE